MLAIRILLLSFLLPKEFGIFIGDLLIFPYRFVLLGLTPYVFWLFFQKSHSVNWNRCDVIAIMLFIWPLIALTVNTNFMVTLESGGVSVLEMAIPYFLIRFHVNSYRTRKIFAKQLFLIVAVLFVVAIPETLSGRHFIHEFASRLVGTTYGEEIIQRLGFWRAKGPTDHAIILGTICAVVFSIAFTLALRQPKYWWVVLFSVGGTIASLSSAPLLALLVQLGLLAWLTVFRAHRFKWSYLVLLILIFYVAIDVVSDRDPFRVMFSYLLLNPETGYTRYYMWLNSFVVIGQTNLGLIFGYGFDPNIYAVLESGYWERLMTRTVDSYWLVVMLRYGIVMLILFALFTIFTFQHYLKNVINISERKDRRLAEAWYIAIISITLIATTVHFWGSLASIYIMLMAVCVGIQGNKKRKKRSAKDSSDTSKKPIDLGRLHSLGDRYGSW